MELFAKLRQVVKEQQTCGELPDFIVPPLLAVAENPATFADRLPLVERLVQEVTEFEIYSNVCCEKIGYDLEDLRRTLTLLGVPCAPRIPTC